MSTSQASTARSATLVPHQASSPDPTFSKHIRPPADGRSITWGSMSVWRATSWRPCWRASIPISARTDNGGGLQRGRFGRRRAHRVRHPISDDAVTRSGTCERGERLVSLERVRRAVAARDEAGLRRTLRPRLRSEATLDLAGNDYLGLAHDPRVTEAAANAARIWGAGSTGSRLVTGTTALHEELEAELADFTGGPAALVFACGYLANLGALTALGGEDVTIVSDAGNHASIIDACRLSRSTLVVVPHRDVDKFDSALAARSTSYAVVVTDAVFSVDGDLAPLREIHTIARRHRALLVVDEAHALGVVGNRGRGAVAAADL